MKQDTKNKPNYYAILTAEVRYDHRLSAMEKLIYAELTALSNAQGFAFPSNEYLATLYGTSERSISRYIFNLQDFGYIRINEIKKGVGTVRKIYINNNSNPLDKNGESRLDKTVLNPLDKSGECYLINNTRDLIIQDSNRESNDIKLDKSNKIGVEITLPLIEKIYLNNNFKRFSYERFFNYYSMQDWTFNNGRKINEKHLVKLMQNWENSEYTDKAKTEANPENEWISNYFDELEAMEG